MVNSREFEFSQLNQEIKKYFLLTGDLYAILKNGRKVLIQKKGNFLDFSSLEKYQHLKFVYNEDLNTKNEKSISDILMSLKNIRGSYPKNKIKTKFKDLVFQNYRHDGSIIDFHNVFMRELSTLGRQDFQDYYDRNIQFFYKSLFCASLSVITAIDEGYLDIEFLQKVFDDIFTYGMDFEKNNNWNYLSLQELNKPSAELNPENFIFPYHEYNSNWKSLCVFLHDILVLEDFEFQNGDMKEIFNLDDFMSKESYYDFLQSKHFQYWREFLSEKGDAA